LDGYLDVAINTAVYKNDFIAININEVCLKIYSLHEREYYYKALVLVTFLW